MWFDEGRDWKFPAWAFYFNFIKNVKNFGLPFLDENIDSGGKNLK